MSKKTFKSAIRSLGRAFRAKDEAGFDEALGELEESVEDMHDAGEEDPDTIEVHNHLPDGFMRDTAIGELPEKGGSVSSPAFDGEEAPPWFKKHEEATDKRFKSMADSIASLKGDRRRNNDETPEEEEIIEGQEDSSEDPNMGMDRRRNTDEPSEREEMAERMRENGADRRNSDEANKAILGELEFEAPPGTGDKAKKARDSKYLEEAFQDTVSKAEVLAPGYTVPTFDAKAPPVKTFRAIDRLRRSTLDLAYNKPETRGVIDQALSGRTFDSKRISFGHARVLFNVVAGAAAASNNSRATDTRQGAADNNGATHRVAGSVQSLADINKRNAEVYARK